MAFSGGQKATVGGRSLLPHVLGISQVGRLSSKCLYLLSCLTDSNGLH